MRAIMMNAFLQNEAKIFFTKKLVWYFKREIALAVAQFMKHIYKNFVFFLSASY